MHRRGVRVDYRPSRPAWRTPGAVAQLGERCVRNAEVVGSNPISSTSSPEAASSPEVIPSAETTPEPGRSDDRARCASWIVHLEVCISGSARWGCASSEPVVHHVEMKSHTEYLTFTVPERMGFENITPTIERIVRDSGVHEGLCLVNAMHITASVFINDDEPGLHADYRRWLETLAPFDAGTDPSAGGYLHNRTGEDNADAHHKRQVMGREVVVAITDGELDFGPWEQIFYGEFDGRRAKRVLCKVIGE